MSKFCNQSYAETGLDIVGKFFPIANKGNEIIKDTEINVVLKGIDKLTDPLGIKELICKEENKKKIEEEKLLQGLNNLK